MVCLVKAREVRMCWPGYETRGTAVLYENGAFRRERFWIAGWHPELADYGSCKFIFGFRGDRETEVTCAGIFPEQTFIVAAEG